MGPEVFYAPMKRDIPLLSFVESTITVVKKMRNALRIVFAELKLAKVHEGRSGPAAKGFCHE